MTYHKQEHPMFSISYFYDHHGIYHFLVFFLLRSLEGGKDCDGILPNQSWNFNFHPFQTCVFLFTHNHIIQLNDKTIKNIPYFRLQLPYKVEPYAFRSLIYYKRELVNPRRFSYPPLVNRNQVYISISVWLQLRVTARTKKK